MNRKEEIIEGLVQARKRILDSVAGLSLEAQNEFFLGIWDIKDLLAHLIGWDYTNIEAVADIRKGTNPRVFKHWDPDWVRYNATLVEKHGEEDLVILLSKTRQSQQELIECVSQLPAEEIERDFGIRSPDGANITIEWFLQFEIDDEGRHLEQIQGWLKTRNHPGSS